MDSRNYLMVICRYMENLNWINEIQLPFIIYNKGTEIELPCISCENEGRESETYLRYITTNYDNLPDVLIFLQGDPFLHKGDLKENISEYISTEKSEIKYLGRSVTERGSNNILNHIIQEYGDFDEHYKKFGNEFNFSQGGQYIVPRKFILNKSLEFWKNLYEIHKFKGEPINEKNVGSSNFSPWEFERLWNLIFHYEVK